MLGNAWDGASSARDVRRLLLPHRVLGGDVPLHVRGAGQPADAGHRHRDGHGDVIAGTGVLRVLDAVVTVTVIDSLLMPAGCRAPVTAAVISALPLEGRMPARQPWRAAFCIRCCTMRPR